jgi:hypothetical protein
MTFTVETNVELPTRKGGRSGSKYPFAQMDVGQSFLVGSADAKVTTLRSAIGAFMKGHTGYKFAVRAVEGGIRVWRVAGDTPADEGGEEE